MLDPFLFLLEQEILYTRGVWRRLSGGLDDKPILWTGAPKKRENGGSAMTIVLKPEQEHILLEAINSGLAHTADEALDQALDSLRVRLGQHATHDAGPVAAVRRLATFGKRHGLSLGGTTIKDLLHESRP
jgi:hypothetical protein